MRAILSDVHGNLEALTAVLADVEHQGIDSIFNLGDTLGYGPNPIECLDLAMQMSVVLLGNVDQQTVLYTPDGLSDVAERCILWTQVQLEIVGTPAESRQRIDFLKNLPQTHQENHFSGNTLYVHGSPRNPLREYIFPEDIYNPRKMEQIGSRFERLCFCGHTQIPGIFLERGPGQWEFIHPEECQQGFPVSGCKLICNVGSVEQPCGLNEPTCYALFDGERIWFRRVSYDVEATLQKIYSVPELCDFLGDRLREGR